MALHRCDPILMPLKPPIRGSLLRPLENIAIDADETRLSLGRPSAARVQTDRPACLRHIGSPLARWFTFPVDSKYAL
jgi:hypothetical protein